MALQRPRITSLPRATFLILVLALVLVVPRPALASDPLKKYIIDVYRQLIGENPSGSILKDIISKMHSEAQSEFNEYKNNTGRSNKQRNNPDIDPNMLDEHELKSLRGLIQEYLPEEISESHCRRYQPRRNGLRRRGFINIGKIPDEVADSLRKSFAKARPGIAGGISGFGIGWAAEHATTGALESCGVSHENAQHAGMASGFGSGWIAEEVITARLGGARPFTVGGAGGLSASGPLAAVATHIHIMNSEICPNVIAASEGNLQSAAQPLASGWVGAELERLNLANSIAEQNAMMDVLSVGGLGAYGYGIRSSLDSITETLDGAERCVSDFTEEWLPEVYNVRDLSKQPRHMMLPGGVRATRCY